MNDLKIFSISSFAKFAQTTRGTLIFYDKIGLLKPAGRMENGYRYYFAEQIAAVNLIRTCQISGIPLDTIKKLVKFRTPALMRKALNDQIEQINAVINGQLKTKELLNHLTKIIDSALDTDISKIYIRTMPEEAVILGNINDYSNGRNDYDALQSFYNASRNKYPDIDINYPVWGYFSESQLRNGSFNWPERYYFNNPGGQDKKPEALYAIGYGNGGYGNNRDLFERVLKFIDDNGYEIGGPSYCEYPLNEISVSDKSQYLARLMVTVRKK